MPSTSRKSPISRTTKPRWRRPEARAPKWRNGRVKAARAGGGRGPSFLRSGLNSTESSAAANPERAITRAVDSPLLRGGLTIVAGVLTGNVLGVGHRAAIAYLLGRAHV